MTIKRKSALFALLMSSAIAAHAQTASPPPAEPATPAAESPTGLADIVVTAQRRSENLQRVPIAVTALSSSDLQASAIRTTSGLAQVTPALTLSNVAGFVEPRIRGLGNASAGPGVENSIAAYVDGVYISSAPGSMMSLSNVERVEVLKGPQGTLFGRNATGGLIQVVTKDPGSTFNGAAHIGYGSFQTLTGDLYLSTPITEGTGIDFAFAGTHMGDGYGKSFGSGQEIYRTDRDLSFRSKLVSHLTDSTTVRLAVDYSSQKSSDPTPANYSGTATTAYRNGGVPVILNNGPWDAQLDGYVSHRIHAGGASLKIDQDLGGDITLSSITAYRLIRFHQLFDADFSPVQATYEDYTQRDRQLSQELQLSGKSGRLRWVVGAYYFRLRATYNPFELIFGVPPTQSYSLLRDKSITDSIAGYAQATWAITDTTNLTGGFRYTRDKRSLEGTSTTISAAGVQTVTTFPLKETTYNTPTWRLSLDHNFTPDVMAYVSWNRGYKSGGYNAQSPVAPPYDPEKLDAYEIGLKSLTFDRRLRLNLAAFYYDYRNIQVNTYIGTLGVIYNGAKAEIYGLDADFDFAATNQLHFNGGIVALHDRFKSFTAAQVATSLGNGLWSIAPGNATGNRLPFAADLTLNLGLRYTVPIGDGSGVFTINNLHSTGYYTQPDNVLKQGSYNQLNMSATWNINKSLSVKAFGNNLLNDAVAVYLAAAATATGASYQPPRTYGIEFGVKF